MFRLPRRAIQIYQEEGPRSLYFETLLFFEYKYDKPPKEYYEIAKWLYSLPCFDVDCYDTEVDVYDIQFINPNKIEYITGRKWKPWSDFILKIGSVMDGNWDIREPSAVPDLYQPYPKKFEELPIFKSFNQHFINGLPWVETEYYQYLLKIAEEGLDKRYSGPGEVKAYLERFDDLYESIQTRGYKPQTELLTESGTFYDVLRNEILIDIGRNGEPQFVENRHRLAIAKILNIELVPVVTIVRHEDWIAKLEQYSGNDESEIV